ncbi:hypothetical protein MN0502_17990 [Arthrobacter sp. MN05-02]|nr:hypothetical protein MN0502_17990 [Arthrobacter sp. MN05-02]
MARPARVDEALGLGGPGEGGEQYRGTLVLGLQEQHVADVLVGCTLLDVLVVAVVPQAEQAEVAHGGVRGGARAHRDGRRAREETQEVAVPRRGTVLPRQAGDGGAAEPGREDCLHAREVALVGHDDHGAPPRDRRDRHGVGDLLRPGPRTEAAQAREDGPG